MGKLIDIDKARKEYSNLTDLTMSDTTLLLTLFGVLDNAPTVEAIPKADYENRLKDEVVAMLEDIKEQLREMHEDFFETEHFDEAYGVSNSMDVIQQKINALKENSHDD